MNPHSLLGLILLFLASAVVVVPLFKRLGLGSVLGYLAVGGLLGPSGLWVISDPKSLMAFAEIGVVLLLFIIGLEVRPSRLWVMRRAVFGLGSAQVVLTSLAIGAILAGLGWGWESALIAGAGLSLSSTPFALQLMAERGQLNTSHGRASFAILLFQDLAVMPMLAILPLVSGQASSETHIGLLPITGVLIGIGVAGRYAVPYLFRFVASTGIREVFAAAALLIVLGTAALVEHTGLSMALGAFLAGVILSGSEYRHELEASIEPFKGLLLGLFFMSVGMSVDWRILWREPALILGATVGLVLLKAVILYVLGRTARFTDEGAKGIATALPQGGEFAFVLFGTAAGYALLPAEMGQRLTLVVTLSMGVTPLLLLLNERFLCRQKSTRETFDEMPEAQSHVIIAGFGRFGQIVGRVLRVKGIAFTALDHSPDQIDVIRRFGNEVYYGDASRPDLLEAAGAARARLFVLAIDDMESSIRTAKVVQSRFPKLPIIARVRNRQHAYELMRLGINVIFRETLSSSLEMAERTLVELGERREDAKHVIEKFREHDEKMLQEQLRLYGNETELVNYARQAAQQLQEVIRSDVKPAEKLG